MKTYHGVRTEDGHCQVTVDGYPLPLRLDLWSHSPSGFEWGYGGSGPAQLALALAADVLGPGSDEKAVRLHQQVKRQLVVNLEHEGWTLTEAQVAGAVRKAERTL